MKTALLLTAYFPPAYDVGGKRAYRFARYLPDCGWRPVIVTAPAPRRRPVDPGPFGLPPTAEVHRLFYPSWWPEPTGRYSDGTVARPVTSRPERAWLRQQFALPAGAEALLTPLVGVRIARLARRVGADLVFASSGPHASLLFGLWAARAAGLPLVLDLRDPWSLNFLQARRAGWVRRVEQKLEERLFRAADRVVLTSAEATAAYARLYPDLPPERLRTIYNSFDPADRPGPRAREGPFRLVHFGNCYGPRRMAPVLRAIARLRERGQPGADALRLVNLGRPAAEDLELARQLGLEEVYSARPFVPYAEGLELLAGADLQVLLAYGRETLFVPAKLFDYLLADSPILCLAEPSELTELVRRTGSGLSARPDDVEGVAAILARGLQARQDGTPLTEPNPAERQALSSPVTARQLAALFDEVCR